MSVALIISNPINEEESNVNVPISTEKVFQDCWIPIINDLDLKWIRCFQSGIEIEKVSIQSVLEELVKMQKWIDINMFDLRGKQITHRLKNLCKELIGILANSRDDIKIYIG